MKYLFHYQDFKLNNLILTVIILISISTQSSWAAYNLEVKGGYESWKTSLYGNANAVVGGVGVAYYKDRYFAGGGLVLGDYALDDEDGKSISRKDLDLVLGYKLDSQWSLYSGYRFNRTNYVSNTSASLDRRENTLGLGIGASFNVVLAQSWIGFGTVSISGIYSYNNADDKGKGYSAGSEGGILYSINPKTTVAVRVKYQTNKIDYDPGEWSHSYIRFGAHLGYLF